ncbi:hypothetical protein VKT23_012087 [Stygiomarasmius scandens]|uniref:Crinkler (CRN) family protein n=1 Tax=Marasmiellus scandens TaxID=2682957 RepID=A0ABR1J6W3_9AGAR
MASSGAAARPYLLLQHLVHAYKAKRMDFTAQDHCESLYDLIYVVDRHMPHDVQYSVLIAALEPLVDVFREANEEKDIEAAFTAFYGSINRFFGSKPIISIESIKSIASPIQKYSELHGLKINYVKTSALWAMEYDNTEYFDMRFRDVEHLFHADADFDSAFKALFEKLGYDISESEHANKSSLSDGEEASRALKASMAVPFRGLSARALFAYLTDCHKRFATGDSETQFFCARYISICNSSGTGKTRAILELPTFNIPLLYINMRHSDDTKNFPPKDSNIAQLFNPAFCSSADNYYHVCLKIFCAIFELLIPEFNKPDQEVDVMINSWNARYTKDVSMDNVERPMFFHKVSQLYHKMEEDCANSKQRLFDTYKQLCRCLKLPERFLVLALDETQEITECPQAEGRGYSPSHMLGRAIADFTRDLDGPAVWVLFSSTNSGITHFAAPAPFYETARVASDRELLFTPFSALEWDVYSDSRNKLDVFSVGEFKTMICFGRPLWKSVSTLHPSPSEMTAYALDKLLCRQGGSSPGDAYAYLALLGQRFALKVNNGSHRARSFVSKGIANHMRYLVYTTEDCLTQCSDYPSEPVLSHAAASYMYTSAGNLNMLLSVLKDQISSGLIQAGELGELMGRLLILIGRDFAAIRAYGIEVEAKPVFPERYHQYYKPFPSTPGLEYFAYLKPVPLLLVLCILFGDEWIMPDHIKAFERAYVSASHWIRITENVGPFPDAESKQDCLEDLFLRGIGIQCWHEQPMIDGLWPILFLKDTDEYDGMSTMVMQIKNWQDAVDPAKNVGIMDSSVDLDTGRPHVIVGINFGGDEEKGETFSVTYPENHGTLELKFSLRCFSEPDLKVLACRSGLAESFKSLKDVYKRPERFEECIKQVITSTSCWK